MKKDSEIKDSGTLTTTKCFVNQHTVIPTGCQTTEVELTYLDYSIRGFSPLVDANSKYYVMAGSVVVNIISAETHTLKSIIASNKDKFINCLKISSNNIIAIYQQFEVCIYSIKNESLIYSFEVSVDKVLYMDFSNCGNFLLISYANRPLSILDIKAKKMKEFNYTSIISLFSFVDSNSVIYAFDCSVGFFETTTSKIISIVKFENFEKNEKVCYISWYKNENTADLALIGSSCGKVWLISRSEKLVVNEFIHPKRGELSNISWLKKEPGTFVTTLVNSGAVYFFNVSSSQMISKIKVSDFSINRGVMLNDDKFLVCLENSASIIYDLSVKQIVVKKEASHSETIFDVKSCYSPSAKINYLFSCGYDEQVKVWNLESATLIKTIRFGSNLSSNYGVKKFRHIYLQGGSRKVKEEPLKKIPYCISISPLFDTDSIICVGDSSGSLRLMNVKKGIQIDEFSLFNKISKKSTVKQAEIEVARIVVGCSWKYNGSHSIIITCLDHFAMMTIDSNTKLQLVKLIPLNLKLSICHHYPFDSNICAIGLDTGETIIYNIDGEKEIKRTGDHTKKVFSTSFNHLREGVLATSSDDFNVIVYLFSEGFKDYKSTILKGHKDRSRKLLWDNIYSYILYSSSWDGTIRIWNVASSTCIKIITENYSDVYGLTFDSLSNHSLISCSRDNTIRMFSINFDYKTHLEYILKALSHNFTPTVKLSELDQNLSDCSYSVKYKSDNSSAVSLSLSLFPKSEYLTSYFNVRSINNILHRNNH